MKRPFFFQPTLSTPPLSLLALMGFCLFFILGCSVLNRGSEPPSAAGDESATVQQVIPVCSQACADRGQCGHLLTDGQPIVFAYREAPALQGPQMIFPADTALPLLGVQDVLLQIAATGEQFNQPFYFVQRADGSAGWIAGWCINAQ